MTPEGIEVLKTMITAGTTLLVSLGTWHVSMKQYRAKNEGLVKEAIEDVKDTVTANQAKTQEHLGIIDYEIKTLSERVDKHNNFVEKTYQMQSDIRQNTTEIQHLKEKIG